METKSNQQVEKSPIDSGKKLPTPSIQRECTGPQLAGFGSKKEKEKSQTQQQQSQTLSQQLESNLGEQAAKQNESLNESLDTSDQEMNQFFQALSTIKPVKIIKTKEEMNETDEQEQELVLESEIPEKVLQLATHGYELLLSKENLTEAIVQLRRAENVISTYLFSEGSVHQSLVLFTLSNLAIAYYRIGFLEESLVCLENCLVSLKNQTEFTTLPSASASKDKKGSFFLSQKAFFTSFPGRLASKRLRCNFHMQCCIILSEMRRHEDALIHSRLAGRLAFKILIDTMVFALAVYICLFYEKSVNDDLISENDGKESENEEQINNENSQVIRRSKRNQEDYQLEDLAITSNQKYDPQYNDDTLPGEIQKQTSNEEDQLNQQYQQLQQVTRVENFSVFMSVWRGLEIPELSQLFEVFNTPELRKYILELVPILLELNTRISGSANHYDMSLSPYKAEIILNTLCKQALNLNSQNIDLGKEVFSKPAIETMFNDVSTDSPLFNSSILALLQLQPLTIEEFAKIPALQDELSQEFILKKVQYFLKILIVFNKDFIFRNQFILLFNRNKIS